MRYAGAFFLLPALLLPVFLHAAPKSSLQRPEFVETRSGDGKQSAYYEQIKRKMVERDAEQMDQMNLIQSNRDLYRNFSMRFRVPGFISSTPLPRLARIIGPTRQELLMRQGDTVFIRWVGAPMPRTGDRFGTFTPKIVTQNLLNPTDFTVISSLKENESLPQDTRLAGYFYETTGRIKIVRVRGGLVEGIVEQLRGQVSVGSELMVEPPKLQTLTPITGGLQLSAAVVCGSPADRLSTTKNSFIYINRGSRDGIRVGRVFESIENVKLDESAGGAAPYLSNGEAIVVHTTDSYSTAMITRQFDVIRMGSLLRTTDDSNPSVPVSPFQGYKEEKKQAEREDRIPEVPNLENLSGDNTDRSLPEPRKPAPAPELSELDAMEKSLKAPDLTPTEKSRLNKLSRQEKVKSSSLEEVQRDTGTPGVPSVENSFSTGKKTAKKAPPKAKKKTKNDEEELNQLMMEN